MLKPPSLRVRPICLLADRADEAIPERLDETFEKQTCLNLLEIASPSIHWVRNDSSNLKFRI